jgi:small subunit ribosomal protein S6
MFLIDSAIAAADWDGTLKMIETILTRNDAEIISMRKWDERKLAFDMDGKSRGTYVLAYFRCETSKVHAIERAVRLSEKIMRVLILRTDRMTQADMDRPTPLMLAEIQPAGIDTTASIPGSTEALQAPATDIES